MDNNRTPDFNNDNAIGKVGENRLKEILMASSKTMGVFDLSDKVGYRKYDIDIKQIKTDGTSVVYEVKTDTYGYITRNVSYELTSHDHAGCLARSNADYVFYVFVNPENHSEILESYLIDLEKWRRWIRVNSIKFNNKYYRYQNENGRKAYLYGFLQNSDKKDSDGVPMNCLQILCNIDTMVKQSSNGNMIVRKID